MSGSLQPIPWTPEMSVGIDGIGLAEQAFLAINFNTDDHLHLETVAQFMYDWIIQHILVEDRQVFASLPSR